MSPVSQGCLSYLGRFALAVLALGAIFAVISQCVDGPGPPSTPSDVDASLGEMERSNNNRW